MLPTRSVTAGHGFHPLLLVVPLAVAATTLALAAACDPLWMGGSTDPSYHYLANSLLLAELATPAHTHHPGTGMQALGAVVLRLLHLASGSGESVRLHVLREPERFLAAIRITVAAMQAVATAFLGWAAFRFTGRLSWAAAAQLAPLAASMYFLCSLLVMCEPLLVALGVALSGALLLVLERPPERGGAAAFALGPLVGFALATKVTALPFVFGPLAVLGSLRRRAAFLLTACATAFAVLLLIAPRLVATARWLLGLAVHAQPYGKGAASGVDLARVSVDGARLAVSDPAFLAFGLVFLAVAAATRGLASLDPGARRPWLALVGVGVAQLFAALAAAKHGGMPHYVVPTAGLDGLGLAVAAHLLLRSGRRRAAGALVVSAAAAIVIFQLLVVGAFVKRRLDVRPGAVAARERVDRGGALVSDRASDEAAALANGNDWAGGAFSEDLRRIYPGVLVFNEARLHAFGRPPTIEELARYRRDDSTWVFWTSKFVPLESCGWLADPRREVEARLGRDVIVRVASDPPLSPAPAAPALPPFVGFLALEGLTAFGTPAPPPGGALWGIGPVTRLAFVGDGRPLLLVIEMELEWDEPQGVGLFVNGEPLARWRLVPRSPPEVMRVPLPNRPGLNELQLSYEKVGPALEADPSRPSGDVSLRPTGVLLRSVQVVRPGQDHFGLVALP